MGRNVDSLGRKKISGCECFLSASGKNVMRIWDRFCGTGGFLAPVSLSPVLQKENR
jgi:hypothetical protein